MMKVLFVDNLFTINLSCRYFDLMLPMFRFDAADVSI